MKRFILAVVMLGLVTGNLFAGERVDLQKFILDTQRLEQGQNSFRLVWWIPTEYWEESFRNVPTLTDDQKREFYKAVEDYMIVCVVDAEISAFGSVMPTSRDQILDKLALSIGQGKTMKPLSDSETSSDAKNLFAMMKPIMANMFGQFGQGMEFICFNGFDAKGKKLFDPKREGFFAVIFADATYKWRLPLGSLLPPKYDPQTGEEFPGNYNYNPFTGKKLESR
jgi:hypothetical protein